MTTNDNPLGELANLVPSNPSDSWSLDDIGRRSLEAFVENQEGTARVLDSRGFLRITGAGVTGNAIPLDDLGLVSRSWQRTVSATAAALSDIKTIRGKLPTDILSKSKLMLNAAPTAGSVILNLVPQSNPLDETEPDGMQRLLDDQRPLADRAMNRLIQALAAIGESAESASAESIEEQLRDLGPRASSTLSAFATIVERANITIEASWQEPSEITVRSRLRPSAAKFLKGIIEGRKLDEEPLTIDAVVRTVSDTDSWRVDILNDDESNENIQMSATDLPASDVQQVRVNNTVRLRVFLSARVLPTGETRSRYRIAEILEIMDD